MSSYIKVIIIMFAFLLTACGGGGGGSSSSQTADVRLAVDLGFDNIRHTESRATGFYVSNTEIGSVVLTYTGDDGIPNTVDITAAAEGGIVELSNLATESYYTFDISAKLPDGTEACSGSAEVFISPNATNSVDLTCHFEEEYARGNAIFDFLDTVMRNEDNLTEAMITEYIATDFGIWDGMDRTEFIMDTIYEGIFDMGDSGVTIDHIDANVVVDNVTDIEVDLYIYFSEGSYTKEHIWMKKENDKWKLAGNGSLFFIDMLAEAYRLIKLDQSVEMFTGLSVDFDDMYGNVTDITVTGAPLSEPYFFEHNICAGCTGLSITSPGGDYVSWELMGTFMVSDDQMTGGEEPYTDPEMSLAVSYSDNSSGTIFETVYGTLIGYDNMTPQHFPTLVSPTSQDMADYMGKSVTFQINLPTAYDPAMTDIEFDFINANSESDYFGSFVPKTASGVTSVTINFAYELLDFFPTEGEMTITSYDSEGKAFTTIIMLENTATEAAQGLKGVSYDSYATVFKDIYYFGSDVYLACGSYNNTSYDVGLLEFSNGSSSVAYEIAYSGVGTAVTAEFVEPIYTPAHANYTDFYVVGALDADYFFVGLLDSDTRTFIKTRTFQEDAFTATVMDAKVLPTGNLLLLVSAANKYTLIEISSELTIVKTQEITTAYDTVVLNSLAVDKVTGVASVSGGYKAISTSDQLPFVIVFTWGTTPVVTNTVSFAAADLGGDAASDFTISDSFMPDASNVAFSALGSADGNILFGAYSVDTNGINANIFRTSTDWAAATDVHIVQDGVTNGLYYGVATITTGIAYIIAFNMENMTAQYMIEDSGRYFYPFSLHSAVDYALAMAGMTELSTAGTPQGLVGFVDRTGKIEGNQLTSPALAPVGISPVGGPEILASTLGAASLTYYEHDNVDCATLSPAVVTEDELVPLN